MKNKPSKLVQDLNDAYAAWRDGPCDATETRLYAALLNQAKARLDIQGFVDASDTLVEELAGNALMAVRDYAPRPGIAFATWSFSVMRRSLTFLLRERLKERRDPRTETPIDDVPVRELSVTPDLDTRILLGELCEPLSDLDRTLLEGKLAGETEQEISKTLGCSKAAVAQRWLGLQTRLKRAVSVKIR